MRYLEPAGTVLRLPVIGQGTWGFGEDPRRHSAEVGALREGFAQGMTLVDTAEFYGAGESERVVGDAVADCREQVFLIAKIWPNHAEPKAMRDALANSLRRLRTDHVDVCLLHWPTKSVPLREITRGLGALREAGLARDVGVSNFPLAMAGEACAALDRQEGRESRPVFFHELPYSLADRRVELSLLWQVRQRGGVLLAYSPLGHGRLLRGRGQGMAALEDIAARHGVTPAQVALAFLAETEGVVVLAKAASAAHVRENAACGDLRLAADDMRHLRSVFASPAREIGFGLPPYEAFFSMVLGGMNLMQRMRGRHQE